MLQDGRLVDAEPQDTKPDMGSIWARKPASSWDRRSDEGASGPRRSDGRSAFAGAMRRPAEDVANVEFKGEARGDEKPTVEVVVAAPEPEVKPEPKPKTVPPPPAQPKQPLTPGPVKAAPTAPVSPVVTPAPAVKPVPPPTRVPKVAASPAPTAARPVSEGPTVMDVLGTDPSLNSGQRSTVQMVYQRFAPNVQPRPEVGANLSVLDALETDGNLNNGQRETIRMIYQRFVPRK